MKNITTIALGAAGVIMGGIIMYTSVVGGQTIKVFDDQINSTSVQRVVLTETSTKTETVYEGTLTDVITEIDQLDKQILQLQTRKQTLLGYKAKFEIELAKLPPR